MNVNKCVRRLFIAGLTLWGVFAGAPQAYAATLAAANTTTSTTEGATKTISVSTTLIPLVSGGTPSYSIVSVGGAVNGTVALQNSNADVVFTPTAFFSGTASFTYTAQDSVFGTATGTVTVTVTAVSNPPTLSVQSATGDEDAAIPLNINITATDTDFSETLSVKIENIPDGASLDNTSHNVPAITFTSGVGSVTLSQSHLSGLTIKPPANSDADFNLSVTGTSTDGTVSPANSSNSPVTLSVTVNPVSDAPTLTVQNASGNEDSDISLSISASKTDSTETLKVIMNDIPFGVTLLDGTTTLTIVNNSVELTTFPLTGLKVRPPANSDLDFTLNVTASSQDGTAIPANAQAVSLNVLVNPVNDEPSFTKGPNFTIEEDAPPQFFSNWATAISPGGGEFGQILTFQVSIPTSAAGLFSVPPAISPEGHLTFTTAPNANSSSPVTATVSLKDNGGTNPGDDTSADQTFTITVNAVNDAPHVLAPFQQNVKEDTALVFQSGNNNLISIADPDAGGVTRLSLSVQSGKINFSSTTGLTFLSVAGTTTPPLTANNSANIVVEGSLADLNAALAGGTSSPGLSYAPDSEFNGPDTLVIVANDLVSGANLIDTKTVNINVTPVNDTPVISNPTPTFNVPENSPPGFFVGKVNATDADPGSSLNFVITTGNLGGVFGINSGSGEIFVNGKLDFEPLPTDNKKFTLSVLVADTGIPSLSATATVTINVTDVNEPPQMARQVFQVNENLITGSTIGSLVSTDPDTTEPNATRTYAIVAGSGNEDNKFALSTAGVLTLSGALDFETRSNYELNVSVTDGGGLSTVAPIAVNVNDNNESPIVSPQTFTVDENAPTGTFVGHVEAVDPDAGHRTNFSITGGNTDNKFGIDQVTGQITVRGLLDFETTPSFSLTVKATDNADSNLNSTATVTVNVRNLNEIPVNTMPASMEVFEDTTITFATGAISISDDSGNELIDVTLKAEHGRLKLAPASNLTFESGADNTGRMRIRGKLSDLIAALNGLQYTPDLNFHGEDFLDILTDDRGASGAGGPQSRLSGMLLRIKPVIDGAPTIRSVTIPFQTLSDQEIEIERNPVDGPEVTHFQITEITGGRLFHHDGRTEIINNNFITSFEAQAGLRFLPTTISPPGSFKAKASLQDNTSGLGGTTATAQITVVKANQFINLSQPPTNKTFGNPPFPIHATASSGLPVELAVSGPATITTDIPFTVNLRGSNERPNPVATTGTGFGTATLVGDQLTINITYSGLTGPATGAHIHGPAGVDGTADVLIDLAPFNGGPFGTSGTLAGTATLTSAQIGHVSSGQTYVNIHTSANSGGEVRGQLVPGKLIALTGAGTVTLTASQPGDDRYNPAPTLTHILGVSKANQTISWAQLSPKTYGDPDFPVQPTPTASSGLTVRLEVTGGRASLTSSGQVHILGAGSVTLAAFQDGNQDFTAAIPVSRTFNVERPSLTVIVDDKSRTFGQPNPTFTGSATGLQNQDPITVVFETSATPTSPVGTYQIFPTFQDPAGKLVNYNLNITRGTLTVNPNAAPVAQAQPSVSTGEDTPATITLTGSDAENNPLTFAIVQGPQHGTLSGAPPDVSYLPAPNFNGTDSFTFRVNDGFRNSSPATVTIAVTPVNDPPTLGLMKSIGVRPDGPEMPIPLVGITAGPPNEQQTLTVTATSSDPAKVTVKQVSYTSPNSSGVLVIQPAAGATGSANITVEVKDDGSPNAAVSRTFAVTVTPRALRVLDTTAFAGSQVAVPVELQAQGDENALGFSVAFDPTKLKFVNAVLGPGENVPAGTAFQINAQHALGGRVGFGVALPANQVSGAGTKRVVVLNFDVPIEVEEATVTAIFLFPEPVPFEVIGAQANPLPAAFDGALVSITHGSEADVTPRPGLPDGVVGPTDWVQVGRFAINLDPVSGPGEFQRADCAPRQVDTQLVLGNGEIGIADWVQAGRYAAALDRLADNTIPRGSGPSGPPQGTTAQSRNTGSRSAALVSAGSQTRRVTLNDRRVGAGQTFVILASMEAQGDENAIGFSLEFDPESLSFVGARLASGVNSAALVTNDKRSQYGELALALALAPGTTLSQGPQALVELEFASVSSAPALRSELRFGDYPLRREVVSATADELGASFAGATITLSPATDVSAGPVLHKALRVVDRTSRGEFYLRLTGEPGQEFVIEASNDLTTWSPIRTVSLKNDSLEFVDTEAQGISARFYRHRLVRKSE